MRNEHTFLVDGASAIAIHNGVVRIQFMRLAMDGKPIPSVELHVPAASIKSVMDALEKIARAC